MVIVIASKQRFVGEVEVPELNREVVVVDIQPQSDDYIVEGYLDLSSLGYGDSIVVSEYIGDKLFLRGRFDGPVAEPMIRLHTKTLPYNVGYRVAVMQVSGTPRSIWYGFVVEVMGVA